LGLGLRIRVSVLAGAQHQIGGVAGREVGAILELHLG